MNSPISLFDSLAHPTLEGNWLNKKNIDASFEKLQQEMEVAHFRWACAIGMENIGGYQHQLFADACRAYPNLIPIAGYKPPNMPFIKRDLSAIANMGFKGIKIHPRFSQLHLIGHESILVKTLQLAAKYELVVFWCTYMHSHLTSYPSQDPFYSLVNLLRQSPQTKVILVHGGDVQLLKYAELVRFNDNLLLDLSLTMQKYAGSSIDTDLQFLFQQFDRRICVGSDFPEYSLLHTRKRFEYVAENISLEKRENIAWRNLSKFLGLNF